uniref:Uncharacterized protein n=1 Tax=Panagrolaimus superbus TaxID=310955 RepID=A0A914Y0L0_9BILA
MYSPLCYFSQLESFMRGHGTCPSPSCGTDPKVKEGYRLDFPDFTPHEFVQIMKTKVWADNANERWTMAEIAHGLEKLTSLPRPRFNSGSDGMHPGHHPAAQSPKQHHQQPQQLFNGDDNQQHHQDSKKGSGRQKIRKTRDHLSESSSNESPKAVDRQSRRQKGKAKYARKFSKNKQKSKKGGT